MTRTLSRHLAALALVLTLTSCADLFGPSGVIVYALRTIDGEKVPLTVPGFPPGTSYIELGDTIRADGAGAGTWDWWTSTGDMTSTPMVILISREIQFFGPADGLRQVRARRCLEVLIGERSCMPDEWHTVEGRPDGFIVHTPRGRLQFQRVGSERR